LDLTRIGEPYRCPGDYNIPKILGNDNIIVSNLQTPPNFSFPKEKRLKFDLIKSNATSRQSKHWVINNFNDA
jgi:hypothetical protein